MPEMDGFEASERIRKDFDAPKKSNSNYGNDGQCHSGRSGKMLQVQV